MTPDCASPLSLRRARATAALAAIALAWGMSCATVAQDSNPGDCAANEKSTGVTCPEPDESFLSKPFFALDWVPLEAVPESLRDRQCINCGGRYIDPLSQEDTHTPLKNSEINAHADSTRVEANEVILTGNADTVQGYRHMHSDTVVIDREQESAALSGNVILREPNVLLLGDSAQIFTRTGEAILFDNQFVLHKEHMRGTADILQRDADGLIHIHNGDFTFCAPGDNDWSVLAKDMEVDLDEGLATAHHATVELEDVPVAYLPWLRLPLDNRRRTGFLWPDFGNDSSGGLDISAPFYFNLAPNYDALYAPRFIENRGLDNQLKLRYMNPLVGQWLAGGAFMKEDAHYQDQQDQSASQVSADRWLGVLRQDGLFNERWRSQIDYSKASDVDYLQDLATANIESQRTTSLLQLESLDYLGDNWLVNLRSQQFQSLANDIQKAYEELPQFTSQYRDDGTPFTVQPILLGQYTNFGATEDVVTGQRFYGEAGLDYPMQWRFGSLKPTVKYRQINYELNGGQFFADNSLGGGQFFPDESPSVGAPLVNLDGKLIFERETSFAGKEMLQTLEPRVYYLYSPYENQSDQPVFDSAELTFTYYQLFRDTRFAGHDRLDDANQVSVGVTSQLIDDQTGRSLLSGSVGQIYYFEDRQVHLTGLLQPKVPPNNWGSEIAGQLEFTPDNKMGLRSSVLWDPYTDDMHAAFFEANYKTDHGAIFNLGYSYRRPIYVVNTQALTNQASVSTYLPLDNHWGIFGALNYSLEDNLSVEDMAGVEYDTCCWTVRMLNLRYYNNVNGVAPDFSNPNLARQSTLQFQFLLKGMGGFGNRITNIMQTLIRGYDGRED